MPRKLFKRWLPTPTDFKNQKSLGFMGSLLQDPHLFHLNRHSVSGALFVGLFVAFLPMPGQMPIAALMAFWFRVNMPISVALVWISNPLTMAPIFFATYELGRWLIGSPPLAFSIDLSWSWLTNEFTHFWKPLLAGSLLTGVVAGASGYIAMQIFWRWHVLRNWKRRKLRRQQAQADTNSSTPEK